RESHVRAERRIQRRNANSDNGARDGNRCSSTEATFAWPLATVMRALWCLRRDAHVVRHVGPDRRRERHGNRAWRKRIGQGARRQRDSSIIGTQATSFYRREL